MTTFTPSLRQLRYLVELRAHGHFGQAALALNVGQSTLSAGIAELERLLGVTLVERTRRQVRFTDLGAAFVERARAVLEAASELTDFVAVAAAPLTGPLRLGVIPTVAPFLLPRVLGPLRDRFPALQLQVREQTSEAACASLHRGSLDCVLLALPYDCGRVETFAVKQDRLLLAVPQGGADMAIDAEPMLLLEDGHCLSAHGLAACGGPSRTREPAMVASSLHTLIGLVEARLGSTFVPQIAIDAGLLEGRDVTARSLGKGAERTLALAWRQGSARAADCRLLGETLAALVV